MQWPWPKSSQSLIIPSQHKDIKHVVPDESYNLSIRPKYWTLDWISWLYLRNWRFLTIFQLWPWTKVKYISRSLAHRLSKNTIWIEYDCNCKKFGKKFSFSKICKFDLDLEVKLYQIDENWCHITCGDMSWLHHIKIWRDYL